ncbi:MAG: hypothetical protein CR984_05030 [Proteobacteria bacterium]|nr:MAG: hypothetical protein CR984_05030 [Pseudomonadota bacterium]PIE68049.1 MAG: hypothetical protein CSA23_00970 [Deltaproteobacteria bacterium]
MFDIGAAFDNISGKHLQAHLHIMHADSRQYAETKVKMDRLLDDFLTCTVIPASGDVKPGRPLACQVCRQGQRAVSGIVALSGQFLKVSDVPPVFRVRGEIVTEAAYLHLPREQVTKAGNPHPNRRLSAEC